MRWLVELCILLTGASLAFGLLRRHLWLLTGALVGWGILLTYQIAREEDYRIALVVGLGLVVGVISATLVELG